MQHRLGPILDAVVLLFAMGFITLGAVHVPFHGDEPTVIWMSRDSQTILEGDAASLGYEPPPRRTTDQHLRILNPNFAKYAIGFSWSVLGWDKDAINEQWVWGWSYQQNLETGHIPAPEVLKLARLASAWLTAIGAVLVLATTRLLARRLMQTRWGIRVAGWMAVAVYTMHPAILVNGRRAMLEGAMFFGLGLVAWAAVWLATRRDFRWWRFLVAGLLAGIALSTKHTAVFTVILLFAALGVFALLDVQRWRKLAGLLGATVLALLVFWLLHPIWWSAPLEMPGLTIQERNNLLELQTDLYGEYRPLSARIDALLDETLSVEPQYYEVPDWTATYPAIDAEIEAYQGWAGLGDNIILRVMRYILIGAGVALLLNTPRWQLSTLMGVWLIGMLGITLVTVPLHWQRYYLPVQVPLVILMGLGAGTLVELVRNRLAMDVLPVLD